MLVINPNQNLLLKFISVRTFISRGFQRLPLLAGFAAMTPGRVFAAQPWATSGCMGGPDGDVATIQCLVPLFRNVVVGVVQLGGVALFLMFVVGGFLFLTSGGDPKKLEQARNTITYAIIGVVVIVSAYLILLLIKAITGVDTTGFTIPGQQ